MRDYAYRSISVLGVFIWCIGTLFYAYEMIVKSSINSLSLVLQGQYAFTATELSLIASMFYWVYVIMQIPAGITIDRIGVRRSLIIASLCCGLGTVVFSLSNGFWMMVMTRAVMGVGGAFAFVCGLKLASQWLSPRFFPLFAGLTQFMGYMGGAFTGAPLSSIVKHNNWGAVFITIGIVGIAISALTFIFVRGKAPFAHDEKDQPSLFEVVCQLLSLIKRPQILANAIFCLCVGGVSFALTDLWGKIYLIINYGVSEGNAAFAANTMVFFGIAFTSPLWGALASVAQSSKRLLVIGGILGVISTTAMLYLSVPSVALQLALLYIFGFLIGAAQASHLLNFDLVKKLVSGKYVATAIALLNMFVIAGAAITQVATGIAVEKIQHTQSYRQHAMSQTWQVVSNAVKDKDVRDDNLAVIATNDTAKQIDVLYHGKAYLISLSPTGTGEIEITATERSKDVNAIIGGSQLLARLLPYLKEHIFDTLDFGHFESHPGVEAYKHDTHFKFSKKWLSAKTMVYQGKSYYTAFLYDSPQAKRYAYRFAMLILPVLFLVALIMALITRDRKPEDVSF
ncbi:MFS transporter [Thiotrichales bacterium 19S3-7]|nr:MFS transporter [Thiotrichales bacterium 19S3-7]MCF6802993.1 MFS transporter [Thiotrichales bacterium 19S3-11]